MWTFEYSIEVNATREEAWAFWSNVANWVRVDPAVEWARLDGAFESGTCGETKPFGAPANAWQLADVDAGRQAVIDLRVPGAQVRFRWRFADGSDGGAVLTQVVEVSRETADQHREGLEALAAGIPLGMHKLATAITHAVGRPPN